ncbi:MAG: hypothetical protein MUF28_14575 [Ignavibacterium sp.]|jgi:hypothetical protein|nr:hypothetical protein [Ignavibacterium sp.]
MSVQEITFGILLLFITTGVFLSPDIKTSDRDEAVEMSFYSDKTHLGNPITTGVNKYLAYPFIKLDGNYQKLAFLFWLIIITWAYVNIKNLFLFAVIFIMTGLVARTMYYRLDEIYFCLVALFLFNNVIVFFIWGILSRNWMIPQLTFSPHLILDYILFIPLIYIWVKNEIMETDIIHLNTNVGFSIYNLVSAYRIHTRKAETKAQQKTI